MWDMRRSADAGIFPVRRVVVQFEYPDAPPGSGDWWLVSEGGDIDLCQQDTGYEVDVLIQCSLRTMTEVWTCKRLFSDAVRSRDIAVKGDPSLASRLQAWLRTSALSRLGSQTETLPQAAA